MIVEKVLSKNTKGGKPYQSILADGKWYSLFESSQFVKEGDDVSIETEQNGKFTNVKSVTVNSSGNATPQSNYTPKKSFGGGFKKEDPEKQKQIVSQSSYNYATQLLNGAFTKKDLVEDSDKVKEVLREYAKFFATDVMSGALFEETPTKDAEAMPFDDPINF